MRLIDADGLFSAIGDREDDVAKAKDRAAGSLETYYGGVADGLLLAKGLIAEEKTIEIYQKSDTLYKPEIDHVHAAGGCYCGECVNLGGNEIDDDLFYCDYWGDSIHKDDFCSCGKRREEK